MGAAVTELEEQKNLISIDVIMHIPSSSTPSAIITSTPSAYTLAHSNPGGSCLNFADGAVPMDLGQKRRRGLSQSLADARDAIRRRVSGIVPRFGRPGNDMDKENVSVRIFNNMIEPNSLVLQQAEPAEQQAQAPRTPSPGRASSLQRFTTLLQQRINTTFSEISTPTWSPSPSPSPITLTARGQTPSQSSLLLTELARNSETCLQVPADRHPVPVIVETPVQEMTDCVGRSQMAGVPSSAHAPPPTRSQPHPSSPTPASSRASSVRSWVPPPNVEDAESALEDLKQLLHPRDPSGKRRVPYKGGDVLRERLQKMRALLWYYTNGNGWKDASELAVEVHDQGTYMARQLRKWTRAFIADRHDLPVSMANTWNVSALDNEDLEQALLEHLQGLGKYICAADIVTFLANRHIQERFGLEDTISLSTAQAWMHALGYRWKKSSNGQYVDGHEREDVVRYRQQVYLPALNALRPRLRQYDENGIELAPLSQSAHPPSSETAPGSSPLPAISASPSNPSPALSESGEVATPVQDSPLAASNSETNPPPSIACHGEVLERPARLLWHDESVFYANDRRVVYWVPEGEKAVPRAKGEGASMMISDFFSAEDGWLRSEDGKTSARRLFRPGKNRDGYFSNDDVIEQFHAAADIAQARWPNEEIVMVLDNAPTHQKREDDALSARQMTKNPSLSFGIDVTVRDAQGKPVHGPDGKFLKQRIRMADTTLPNGEVQSLYFPDDHPVESLRVPMSHSPVWCLSS
ncbi:hypothetical protein C8Q76DRAFT_691602 [Earliella scabrosa]|nr:hypothetical protein C8Q76DRAFT_691602 [Earliella scabrosa]